LAPGGMWLKGDRDRSRAAGTEGGTVRAPQEQELARVHAPQEERADVEDANRAAVDDGESLRSGCALGHVLVGETHRWRSHVDLGRVRIEAVAAQRHV